MRRVGRGPLALLLVAAVLAGGCYGVAVVQPATADADGNADREVLAVATGGLGGAPTPADAFAGIATHGDGQAAPATSSTPDADSTVDEAASPDPDRTNQQPSVSTSAQQANGQPRDAIVLEQRFSRLPDRPGQVEVTYDYSIPDPVVSFRTAIPRRGNVTNTDGFVAANETLYDWDESTAEPSLTYRLGVNETGSLGHEGANGSLLFADVGEWALFRRPPNSAKWEYRSREPITMERHTVTEGPGAAGEWLVYLGEVDLRPRTTDNRTFRLAVPAAANMSESPDDVLDAMERAAADLEVGDDDDAVFAVAAPTRNVSWGVRGLSLEGTDFWVGADERLDTTDNIWIHEFVHTLQEYRPTATTRWTREGFATYYAAYQAMQHQDVSFEAFADAMATSEGASANVTLSDPDTWANRSEYERGALVAGQVDRRIRRASDGDRSLASVVAAMNEDAGRVNGTELYAMIDRAGDGSTDQAVRTAIATDRPVAMWNRSQHVSAFGGLPPQFTVRLDRGDASPYRVAGRYRNGSLAAGTTPTVATGEALVVDARVENVGGSSGYYDVSLRVNGTVVDAAEGNLSAGSTRTVPLEHRFTRPGTYTIGVGNETATVRVVSPARASIAGFDVNPGYVQQYESATVSVTVRNDADVPAERAVRLRRGTTDVVTRSVRLGPNATRTARFNVTFPTSGTTAVGVGDGAAVHVDVEPSERPVPKGTVSQKATAVPNGTADGRRGPSSSLGTGVGSLAVVVALVGAMLLVRYRT